jgi:uncharacterized protein YkwD
MTTTLRIGILIAVAAAVITAAAVFVSKPNAVATIREADSFEAALAAKVNAARRSRGLPPFRRSQGLAEAAAAKAHEMPRLGYFAHNKPSGELFWRQVLRHYPRAGYSSWRVGENLAWGAPNLTPTTVIQRWLKSPPHRANLLSRTYREFGVGGVLASNATGFWAGRGDVVVIAMEVGVRR